MIQEPIEELAQSIIGHDLEDGEVITDTVMVSRIQDVGADGESIAVYSSEAGIPTSTLLGMLEMAKSHVLNGDDDDGE